MISRVGPLESWQWIRRGTWIHLPICVDACCRSLTAFCGYANRIHSRNLALGRRIRKLALWCICWPDAGCICVSVETGSATRHDSAPQEITSGCPVEVETDSTNGLPTLGPGESWCCLLRIVGPQSQVCSKNQASKQLLTKADNQQILRPVPTMAVAVGTSIIGKTATAVGPCSRVFWWACACSACF